MPFDNIEIPTRLLDVNRSDCHPRVDDAVAIYTGILPAYGKAAPLRRNPSGIRTNVFKIDSKVVMVSHSFCTFYCVD